MLSTDVATGKDLFGTGKPLDPVRLEGLASSAVAESKHVQNPIWQAALLRLASAATHVKLLYDNTGDASPPTPTHRSLDADTHNLTHPV